MVFYSICSLLAFITGAPCAIFIFFHKPYTSAKRMWGLYSLTISLWGLLTFLMFTTNNHDHALLLSRIINFLTVLIAPFFLHFVIFLTGTLDEYKRVLVRYYVVCAIFLAVTIIWHQHYVVDVRPIMDFKYYPQGGILYYFFPLIVFIIYSHSLVVLYRSFKKASSIRRNQYKYLAITTLIFSIGASSAFYPVFGIPLYPYGEIVLPLHDWMIVYIVAKYHLLDIRLVIRKGLIYGLLASVITIFYFLAIYVLERIFQNMIGYQSLIGTLGIMLIIGILFVPLKDYIQSFVDKHFFKASYMQILEQNDLLRQQIVRAERYETMSSLSRRIIDELRNPLTALVGYGYQLPKKSRDQEFLNKFVLVFNREVSKIQELINQLSDFSEMKELDLKPVDIVEVINEVLEHLAPQVKEKNILFYKYYRNDVELLIKADRDLIKKAFYIFLVKSIRSTASYGQIWVGIEDSMNGLEISIKDTGLGLNSEELARIFDPLTAISRSSEDAFGSLASAQNIVSHHGGKVMVDSQVNIGTEWIIQLQKIN